MFGRVSVKTIKKADNITKVVIVLIFLRMIYTHTVPYGAGAIILLILYMFLKKSNNNLKIGLCILSILVMVLQYTDRFDIVIGNILSQVFSFVIAIAFFYFLFRMFFKR